MKHSSPFPATTTFPTLFPYFLNTTDAEHSRNHPAIHPTLLHHSDPPLLTPLLLLLLIIIHHLMPFTHITQHTALLTFRGGLSAHPHTTPPSYHYHNGADPVRRGLREPTERECSTCP